MMFGVPVGELALLAAAIVVGGVVTGIAGRPVRHRRRRAHRAGALRSLPRSRRVGRGPHAALRRHLARDHRSDQRALVSRAPRQGRGDGGRACGLDVPVVVGVAVGAVLAAFAPGGGVQACFVVVASMRRSVKLLFGSDGWRIADDLPGRPLHDGLRLLHRILLGSLMGVSGGSIST